MTPARGERGASPGAAPWSRAAVVGVAVACVLGVALLAAAARGAGRETSLDAQVAWLNLAVVGSVVAATGQVGLLVVGRLRVGRLRRLVVAGMTPPAPRPSRAAHRTTDGIVAVPGASWYHRPSCPLAAGKALRPLDHTDGMAPCAVCEPALPS